MNELGCAAITEIGLIFSTQQIQPISLILCDDDADQDGITQINLAQSVSPILTQGLPATISELYFTSLQEAFTQTNALPNIFTNSTAFQQTLFARFQNGVNCVAIQEVILNISAIPNAVVNPTSLVVCKGSSLTLSAQPNFTYLWSTGATARSITVNEAGNYTVTVTNANGCAVNHTFTVTESEVATIENVVVNDFQSNRNSIEVIVSGSGNYTFSIDGINFQNSRFFFNRSTGAYTVFVREASCGIVTKDVIVADFPKFFTPNGDGFNDYWHISGLNRDTVVTIYDRYGKVIYAFRGNGIGWDGTFNGRPLPSSDYWFTIQRPNQPEIKGHFSLVR